MNKNGTPENKQEILTAICEALRLTDNAGDPRGNALREIRYIPEGVDDDATLSSKVHNGKTTSEIARPIFENGNGENGYYDVCITGSSGTSIFKDIVRQFVDKVW